MDRVELSESISAAPKVPVDKTFRPFNPDQVLLLPPSLVLRGRDAARNEWLLLAACHDFRKLHGRIGVSGLGSLATA